jgi:hypothetical protein|tara:strand:+ start:1968 stop:2846 length:879 start_codon:yes stop_codon:yes gene_type:complete
MKKKIWIVCWWDEIFDKDVATRTFRNWTANDFFEMDEKNYEYLIVLGALNSKNIKYFRDPQKTIGFMLEPEWSTNWQRDLHKFCKYVVAQDKNMYPYANNIIEHPMFMFTESTDDHSFYLNNSFPKKKRMSIISSNYGHKLNYEKRHALFKGLLDTDLDIDFYGRRWELNDPRYKGAPYNKSEAIVDYQYSIAIENSSYNNYVTEKFFDLVVCNTVPVYYGAPNIADVYPQQSFIHIDFSGPIERTVEQIKDIYNNDNYDSRLPHVLEAKNLYYTKYNIFNFLENLIKQGKI